LKYPSILALMILVLYRILIDLNDKYIHFAIIQILEFLKKEKKI